MRTEDRMIEDRPPQPVIIMGADDGADAVPSIVNAAGEVTEASAAGIAAVAGQTQRGNANQSPLTFTAAGVGLYGTVVPWYPIVPVAVTADGAGNPPATEIIAAAAGQAFDIMLFWKCDTVAAAGQNIMRFREATGAPAAVVPPWAAVVVPTAAGETFPNDTYGVRVRTVNDALNFGVADGANADWPNGAICTFWGFYREI